MNFLALDIGTHKFAALEVRDGQIARHASLKHAFAVLRDGQVENVPMATKELSLFLERSGLDMTLPVALAVAGKSMAVRVVEGRKTIQGEFVKENDVLSLLLDVTRNAHIEGYLLADFDVSKWLLDDMTVSNPVGRHGKELRARVVLQFFRKDTVLSLIKAVKDTGLEIWSISSEAVASKEAAVPPELRYFNIALVDVGAGTSDVTVFRDGAVYNFSSVAMAGDFVTQFLSQKFMIPIDVAERLKVRPKSQKVLNVVGKAVNIRKEDLLKGIEEASVVLANTIAAIIVEANDKKAPSAVALVGGGSLTPRLAEYLARVLDIPSEMVHVAKLKAEGELQKPEWAVALGLARLSPERNVAKILVQNKPAYFLRYERPTVESALRRAELDLERLLDRETILLQVKVGSDTEDLVVHEENELEYRVNGRAALAEDQVGDGDEIVVERLGRSIKSDFYVIIETNTRERVPISLVDDKGRVISAPVPGVKLRFFPSTRRELEEYLTRVKRELIRLKGPDFIMPGVVYKQVSFSKVKVSVGSENIVVPVDEGETLASLLAYLNDLGVLDRKPLRILSDGHELSYTDNVSLCEQVTILYDKNRGSTA
ncbi:cell division protein FtsA [Coprothermobacteraceae bacterium]|nr:cell division protein FtsA [Coprothermobacteraceae bacterium]